MRRWKGQLADQYLVAAFATAQCALVAICNWSWAASPGQNVVAICIDLFFCIILPFLIWSTLISLIDLVQHTNPRVPWFNNKDEWSFYHAQVLATTHVELPWFLRISSHNILEHNAHHVDPRVPMYHLHQAQNELEASYQQEILHPKLTLRELSRILQTCQLYDYDNHCWMSFSGVPTTPRLLSNVR
jgi:omega-6 fatty acid desaturase (delta-12 desaturase)